MPLETKEFSTAIRNLANSTPKDYSKFIVDQEEFLKTCFSMFEVFLSKEFQDYHEIIHEIKVTFLMNHMCDLQTIRDSIHIQFSQEDWNELVSHTVHDPEETLMSISCSQESLKVFDDKTRFEEVSILVDAIRRTYS
jgi:hypothetical protein